MSAITELYFLGTSDRPKRGELDTSTLPYLVTGSHLPILWLGLLDPADERIQTLGRDSEWHYYAKPVPDAIELLASRRKLILDAFPHLRPKWFEQFIGLLSNAAKHYVHIETAQVGSVVCTPDEWNAEMKVMLGLFSERKPTSAHSKSPALWRRLFQKPVQHKGWALYLQRVGAIYEGDKKGQSWVYCGASGTDEVLPWEVES